jgi:hypothetical protein
VFVLQSIEIIISIEGLGLKQTNHHAGSTSLRANMDVLSHSSGCLLNTVVIFLHNGVSDPEEVLYKGRFHSTIYRDSLNSVQFSRLVCVSWDLVYIL